ncbi:hypothetical protein QFC22_006175 [Naganishia vaughanmartiniae]|uniref:Uncharacterized protein n=1 Tax=Naganishia vaughanmartiniae TaxID=1424756 RepID=A0ACC2WLQ0_9TREE|nr:hypothetical protein QFC22_006175 [Naganishia vaughanmartiniae]
MDEETDPIYQFFTESELESPYDTTGRTTESSGSMFDDASAMGSWEAYFSAMYQKVDRKMLDEDKKRYQGSEEEISDLHAAYTESHGSLPHIMSHIPHSTASDEPRFIDLINTGIKKGILEPEVEWEKSSKDEKAKKERAKKAKKEEKEAEAAARELGVWDEFYGSGKKTEKKASAAAADEPSGKRGTKRKSTANTSDHQDHEEEADVSGLASLIAKRQSSRASAFDALLAKYGGNDAEDDEVLEFSGKVQAGKGSKTKSAATKKGKKNGKNDQHLQETLGDGMPTEEEFQRLQEKLFKKDEGKTEGRTGAGKRKTR